MYVATLVSGSGVSQAPVLTSAPMGFHLAGQVTGDRRHFSVPVEGVAVYGFEVTWADTDVAILTLTGEHDLASEDALHDELRTLLRAGELVVVDLSEVEYVDSSVLRQLWRASDVAQERRQSVALQLGTSPIVRRLLELTGFLQHFPCASSRIEAVELARRSAGGSGIASPGRTITG